jgi:anti-sigma B factor antagonist
MSEDLALGTQRAAGHIVLTAKGYLDISTCGRLRDALHSLIEELVPVVVLDLSDVTFIDSSSLGVILGAWKALHAEDGVLAVVAAEPRVTKLFEITALSLTIPLYASLAAARAELGLEGVEA